MNLRSEKITSQLKLGLVVSCTAILVGCSSWGSQAEVVGEKPAMDDAKTTHNEAKKQESSEVAEIVVVETEAAKTEPAPKTAKPTEEQKAKPEKKTETMPPVEAVKPTEPEPKETVAVTASKNAKPQNTSTKKATPETMAPVKAVQKTPKSTSSFSGSIRLAGKGGEVMNPEGIIIMLEPKDAKGHKKQKAKQVMVDMKDKMYQPGNLTVSLQDDVNFRNLDRVKHNVFSSSSNNSFDLGTYGAGKSSDVQFEKSGIVRVYCNIHPDMVAFIGVSEFDYSDIADNRGQYKIDGLVSGTYSLTIWSPRGEIKQDIYIPDGKSTVKNFTLNTETYQFKQHKNKFGKDYREESLFDDEFY